jgi:threonine/homoserine/homoserine lactone efflux protein
MIVALFNPYAFIAVNSILGKVVPISDKSGCPTLAGFIVHLIVFTLVLRYSMGVGK